MRRTLSLAIVLALVSLAPALWAEPLHSYSVSDGRGIRSILIEAPDRQGSVCMVSPEVTGDCDQLPPEALASAKQIAAAAGPSHMIGAGIVQLPDCRLIVAVSSMPYKAVDLPAESIDEFLRGMNGAAAENHAVRVVEPAHRTLVGKWEGLQLVIVQPAGAATVRTTSVGLFGNNTYYSIALASACGDSPAASEAQQHMLSTLDYEPGDLGLFGKSRDYIRSYRTSAFLFRLAPFLVVAGVAGFGAWTARKRRRAAAAPRP